MKKVLLPLLLALLGLGAGVGAGMALRSPPAAEAAAACPGADGGEGAAGDVHDAAAPCPPAAADPFAPVAHAAAGDGHGAEARAYVAMDKPFVVPVFKGEKVVAMVVVSLSVETDTGSAPAVEGLKPRLRDSFLEAMFRHANSGGFDGSFTAGTRMDDLKAALLQVARGLLPGAPIGDVLVTEIARQDV